MAFRSTKKLDLHWFTPEDQEDDDNPLQFRVRPLTSNEQADVLSTLAGIGRAGPAVFRDCYKKATQEVRNAEKPNGKPCKSPGTFLMMQDTYDYIIEVGAYIFDLSFDDEDEKKT